MVIIEPEIQLEAMNTDLKVVRCNFALAGKWVCVSLWRVFGRRQQLAVIRTSGGV